MKRKKLSRRHYIKQGRIIVGYLTEKYGGKDEWVSLKDIMEDLKAKGVDGDFWPDDVGNTLIAFGYKVRKPERSTGYTGELFFNFKERDTGWGKDADTEGEIEGA